MSTFRRQSLVAYGQPLHETTAERPRPHGSEVLVRMTCCGVCHSDLHTVRNEWKNTTYPAVPGHEIVGRVTAVGHEVKRFQPGDLAAVGCMVDSDRTCPAASMTWPLSTHSMPNRRFTARPC